MRRARAHSAELVEVLWGPGFPYPRREPPAEDLALAGRPGLARHALGAAPARAGSRGSGRGPEFMGAAPPSLSPGVARDDGEAFGAVRHRGQ